MVTPVDEEKQQMVVDLGVDVGESYTEEMCPDLDDDWPGRMDAALIMVCIFLSNWPTFFVFCVGMATTGSNRQYKEFSDCKIPPNLQAKISLDDDHETFASAMDFVLSSAIRPPHVLKIATCAVKQKKIDVAVIF